MLLGWNNSCFLLLLITVADLLNGRVNRSMECHCEGDGCPSGKDFCTAPINGKCYVSLKEEMNNNERQLLFSAGCFDESAFFQCKGGLLNTKAFLSSKTFLRLATTCCDDEDFCNAHLDAPQLPEFPTTTEKPLTPVELSIVLSIIFALSLGIASIGIYGCCRYRRKKIKDAVQKQRMENLALLKDPFAFSKMDIDVEKTEKPNLEMTSGSGSGLPHLVQTTIAKQLQFISNVGKGRYGEVWLARFRGGDVAVKIFLTLEEHSWEEERKQYETVMFSHENLLAFIAADIGGTGACTQMLLITQYHPSSLFDYLRRMQQPLSDRVLLHMAEGIASGLSHLHAEIVGTAAKPAIVHRDIKSKNILVKSDGKTCIIGDFGLAMREDKYKELPVNKDMRQGTKRYMAPEILDGTVLRCFEALKLADMYAFALVMWELIRCTGDVEDFKNEYELPYCEQVGSDPGFEEMRLVVSVQKVRPDIKSSWIHDEVKGEYVRLMKECWSDVPNARLTALRAKKSLGRLQDKSCLVLKEHVYS